MMELLNWITEQSVFMKLGFWLLCMTIVIACTCLIYTMVMPIVGLPMRLVRASILRKIGWPPPHLDGDGDAIFKETTETTETTEEEE